MFYICLLILMLFISTGTVHAQDLPEKRALIIAIGNYPDPERNGYGVINAQNDVPLIQNALARQGFSTTNINVLSEAEADRDGMLNALNELVASTNHGDIVVFHFSGHGDQITDDNGDELDGYDEVLVPYGAPGHAFFKSGREAAKYRGDRHIRDDELGMYFQRLRQKAGPKGNIVVWLDACYSGTGTRAATGPQPRGNATPIGLPADTRQSTQAEERGGVYEITSSTRGEATELAPFIVISASGQAELNYETTDSKGKPVGSLSLALSRTLSQQSSGSTYQALFDLVSVQMSALAPHQSPQLEGDVYTAIFSGATVDQEPHFSVEEVLDDSLVVLSGGALVGLREGTRIGFFPIGTTNWKSAQDDMVAKGRVDYADELQSEVVIESPVAERILLESWAFPLEFGYGALSTKVKLAKNLEENSLSALEEQFNAMSIVTLVPEGEELRVEGDGNGGISVVSAVDNLVIDESISGNSPDMASIVGERILNITRNQYLKQVEMQDDEIEVSLELIPATHTYGRRGCTASDTTQYGAIRQAGYWELHEGDGYLLQLRNTGFKPAYVAVLDLMPDGEIGQLFPLPGLSREEAYLEPGQVFLIESLCYEAAPPFGNEILKLFATHSPIDFTPILSSKGETRGTIEGSGPLHHLLADVHAGTRSKVRAVPAGTGSTSSIKIRVVEK